MLAAMTVPAWFWPPSGATARGVALAASGIGLVVPEWVNLDYWPFFLPSSGSVPVSGGTSPIGLGVAFTVPDGSGGAYFLTWGGVLSHIVSGATTSTVALPSGAAYVGLGLANGLPYALAANGSVYSSGGALVNSFGSTARGGAAVSGALMYAILAPLSGMAHITLPGGSTGSLIAFPTALAYPSCITAASGSHPIAVGGWQNAPALAGANALAFDAATAQLALGATSGSLQQWSVPVSGSDAWSASTALSGVANLKALAWLANGTQALGCDPTSGVVQVINTVTGALSLRQTLALSNASALALLPDSQNALVCQQSLNLVTPLATALGTWTAGASPAISLPSPVGVVALAVGTAAVAYASGLALLSQQSGPWTVAATGATTFVPTLIAADAFGCAYVAGSGAFAVFSGATRAATGIIASGAPSAMAVDQGRLYFAIPAVSGIAIYGRSSPTTWTQQGFVSGPVGTVTALLVAGTTIFAATSGATSLYCLSGTPYALSTVKQGVVGFYSGSTWTTGAMGVGQQPSAIAYDVSGNLLVVTSDNSLLTFSPSGVMTASGAVAQYSPQPQTTPAGLSALLVSGASLFAATSMAGALVQVR